MKRLLVTGMFTVFLLCGILSLESRPAYIYLHTIFLPDVPEAPSDLTVSDATVNSLQLTWADNSVNEDGFEIQRGTASGGPYPTVQTVGADVTSFTDTGLSEGTE
ncbi:MAG: fibronectin type III domain-containing protein, partial [Bacteroidetes bacterium]